MANGSEKAKRPPVVPCGVNRCMKPREPWQLACKAHWGRLPAHLQAAVWKGYKEDRDGPTHHAAITACLDFWKKERDDAGRGTQGDGAGSAAAG